MSIITQGIPDVPTIPDVGRLQQLADSMALYINGYTNASAAAHVAVSVGKNKTKGKAIKAWLDSVWTLYYQRVDLVNVGQWADAYLDFSSCGPAPYTLREVIEE